MEQIERFNLAVTTITVAIMFIVLEYIAPLLQSPAATERLLAWFPLLSADQVGVALKIVVTALISIGTYKVITRLLVKFFDFIPLLKRWVFGPSYIEGTWIGRFNDGNSQPKLTVEHFIQSLGEIVIRGWAFNADGSTYADWSSDTVSIDAKTGNIRYTYQCDVMFKNTSQQGIGSFKVTQTGLFKNPTEIKGYSADLTDGSRSENTEAKISRSLLQVQQALVQARAKFP